MSSSDNLNGKSVVIDQVKAEAFAGRMLDVLNNSLLGLMISIGYQTNLFDVMSRLSSPATSAEIAEAANLNERYVREWLGAMVTGKIVDYDPSSSKYRGSQQNMLLFLQRMQGLITLLFLCSIYHCSAISNRKSLNALVKVEGFHIRPFHGFRSYKQKIQLVSLTLG